MSRPSHCEWCPPARSGGLTALSDDGGPEVPGYISRVEVTDPGGPNREAAEILAWNATVMTVAQVAEHLDLIGQRGAGFRGTLDPSPNRKESTWIDQL